jgi:hypothetical protein
MRARLPGPPQAIARGPDSAPPGRTSRARYGRGRSDRRAVYGVRRSLEVRVRSEGAEHRVQRLGRQRDEEPLGGRAKRDSRPSRRRGRRPVVGPVDRDRWLESGAGPPRRPRPGSGLLHLEAHRLRVQVRSRAPCGLRQDRPVRHHASERYCWCASGCATARDPLVHLNLLASKSETKRRDGRRGDPRGP